MNYKPSPPAEEGKWTLLQQRINRILWQWERPMPAGQPDLTRYVITHDGLRLDYDDVDEAEEMSTMMDS